MAQSIGSLVVRLGLDAAEFTTGLQTSEKEARKFARQLDQGIAFAASAATVAIGAITVAAGAAFVAFNNLTKEAAAFKDIEEITGANAEAMASFALSAGTAGTSMQTIATASVKLTKSLTGVDDESKAAGAALTALGLPIQQFKALKPEQQIEEISKALAGFEDGASKTAVAVALFGKAGAELLPFLKQLNEDGGRQVILTQEQIEAADRYADSQARLRTQISLYGQVIATEALKPLELFTRALIESITKTSDLGTTIKTFAADGTFREWFNDAARAVARGADAIIDWGNALKLTGGLVKTAGEQIAGLGQQFLGLDRLTKGQFAQGMDDIRNGFDRMTGAGRKWVADLREAANRTTVLATLNRKIAESDIDRTNGTGFRPPKKPSLNFDGAEAANKGARAERQSDAERYLASLNKQLEATFELSAVEKVTLDIMSGRLKLSNGITEQQLLDVAQAIDNAKAETEARKELAKTLQEEARIREQAGKMVRKEVDDAVKDREKLAEGNQLLRDEIAIIQGGETARRAIEQARLSSALALKEEALNAELSVNGNTALSQALEDQIRILKERQGLLTSRNVAEDAARTAELIRGYNQQIGDSFASQFEAVISGKKKASDALKDFAKDVEQMITRIAAKNIAEAIFGGGQSGKSGAFDFGSIIQSLFGSTGGGVGGFATGGSPPVGKASMVGEHGRELFVPKVSGTIIPNPMTEKMLRGGSSGPQIGSVIINMSAGTSRQSAEQMALHAGRELSHVLRRRN